jgi:RNA polymerase sigma factor (sigma-70 family)
MLRLKVIQLYKSEENLIKKAKKQNRDAQRILFDRYAPKMLGACRQYIKDLQYAEDCMITGFAKVFKNLDTYKNKGSFEGWMRRIMVRECINFLRVKKPFEYTIDDFNDTDVPFTTLGNSLELDEIQELIDELPDGYRMVFNMFVIEGYKHQEIAAILGIDVNTSKSQLFKARKQLQKNYAKLNVLQNGT